MRTILLVAAALLSIGFSFFVYLFLNGQLNDTCFAFASLGMFILMTFMAFHFIYLYLQCQQRKK